MPNSDYILRSDALDALTVSALLRNLDSVEDGPAHMYKRAAERIIAGVPAADVEPVRHGYWVYKMRERNKCEFVSGFDHLGDWHTITVITHVKGPVPYCGLCGALAADSFLDCCPRCGAKMDMEPQKGDAGNAD